MHRSFRCLCGVALLLCGSAVQFATAGEAECDTPQSTCSAGNYRVLQQNDGSFPDAGVCPMFSICHGNGAPVAESVFFTASQVYHFVDVTLNCEPLGSGQFLCESEPQGDGLSYGWSTTGMTFSYPPGPTDAGVFVECDFGTTHSVTVTVYSPQGVGSTKSKTLGCSRSW